MKKLIVVGTGHAWEKFYRKTVADLNLDLIGTVDPVHSGIEEGVINRAWHVKSVSDIPQQSVGPDVVVMVLTPDHYQVIEDLAKLGFKNILCEKPLVSRVREIQKLEKLLRAHPVKLYAIDFYLPKMLGLQVALGQVGRGNPRYDWVKISDPDADFASMIGDIEGIGVQVIEAGNFCLPDIASRPYLAHDKEIGGMILDLVTHVCGPLYAADLLQGWQVRHASLDKLRITSTSGQLVPVIDGSQDVEMYVSALLEANGIPIQIAFGKVPFAKGGLWALEIRGTKGMYFAGMRTGQPGVLIGNDGKVVTFTLAMTTYEIVTREALLYFDGLLPDFDGNYGAFLASMDVGRDIAEKYRERLKK
jgi:predicted dehydrogenase